MASVYEKERELQREVARTVESGLPGVEVLAVELSGPERFTVFVDHPQGVDHALCERVTDALRDYLRSYSVDVSSPGLERPLRRPRALPERGRPEGPASHRGAQASAGRGRRGRRRRRDRANHATKTSRSRTTRSCGGI